jgi:hypothetical protein
VGIENLRNQASGSIHEMVFSMLPHATEALTAIASLRTADLGGAFAFVINGAAVRAHPSDAAALSPAVALQLSVDACVRTFAVDDSEVNAGAVSLFGCLSSSAQSAVSPPFPDSDSDPERWSLK